MVSSYMEISRADKIVCYCVYYALPFPSKGHMTHYAWKILKTMLRNSDL